MADLISPGHGPARSAAGPREGCSALPRPRAADVLLVLAAVLAYVAALSVSNISLDTARDLLEAYRILGGDDWVLRGPIIGGGIYLGPLWFYLLTPAIATASATAVAVWVGLLGGSKFMFGWLLGASLGGRGLARGVVVALALPAWPGFEMLVFSHTNLIVASGLGFLFGCVRLWRQPTTNWLVWVTLFGALMLHAHPSLVVWFPAALPGLAKGLRAGSIAIWHLVVGAVAAAGLFAMPWFAPAGDSRALGAAHLLPSSSQILDAPAALIGLMRSIAIDGPRAVVGIVADWQPWLAGLLMVTSVALVVVGSVTVSRRWRHLRTPILIGLGLCVASLVFCALVRPLTPLYMVYAPSAALAAVIGLGLGVWLRGRGGALAALALMSMLMLPQVLAMRGHSELGVLAIRSPNPLDVGSGFPAAEAGTGTEQLSPLASDRLGRLLCEQPGSIHGPLAPRLDLVYGLPTRLACGLDLDQLQAIGAQDLRRWAGLPAAAWQALALTPEWSLGQWGLVGRFDVIRAPALDWASYRSQADFPPGEWMDSPDPPSTVVVRFRVEPGQSVVATDRRHFVGLNERPRLENGRHTLEPVWGTVWSTAWQPKLAEPSELTLEISGRKLEALEVIVLPAAPPALKPRPLEP